MYKTQPRCMTAYEMHKLLYIESGYVCCEDGSRWQASFRCKVFVDAVDSWSTMPALPINLARGRGRDLGKLDLLLDFALHLCFDMRLW